MMLHEVAESILLNVSKFFWGSQAVLLGRHAC